MRVLLQGAHVGILLRASESLRPLALRTRSRPGVHGCSERYLGKVVGPPTHSSPSTLRSFFQIGTDSLSRSMM